MAKGKDMDRIEIEAYRASQNLVFSEDRFIG